MKTYQQLSSGMVFKNYPALCEHLGWTRHKGKNNARRKQFEELGRHCSYHTEGHKIIIDSVHEIPLHKESTRKRQASKATRLLAGEILKVALSPQYTSHWSKGNEDYSIYLTKEELKRQCSLVNPSYYEHKKTKKMLSQSLEIEVGCVEDFYHLMEDGIRKTLNSALKLLQENGYLTLSTTKRLVFDVELGNQKQTPMYASDNQLAYLNNMEQAILSKYGMSRIGLLNSKDDTFKRQFYREVVALARESASNQQAELVAFRYLKRYHSVLEITLNKELVEQFFNQIETGFPSLLETYYGNFGEGLKKELFELSETIAERTIANAQRNHKKALNNGSGKHCLVRQQLSYVASVKRLVQVLIKKEGESSFFVA